MFFISQLPPVKKLNLPFRNKAQVIVENGVEKKDEEKAVTIEESAPTVEQTTPAVEESPAAVVESPTTVEETTQAVAESPAADEESTPAVVESPSSPCDLEQLNEALKFIERQPVASESSITNNIVYAEDNLSEEIEKITNDMETTNITS